MFLFVGKVRGYDITYFVLVVLCFGFGMFVFVGRFRYYDVM